MKKLKMEHGNYKTEFHCAVIGDPTAWYVYIRDEKSKICNWSRWMIGNRDYTNKFRELFKLFKKDRKTWLNEATRIFEENKRTGNEF